HDRERLRPDRAHRPRRLGDRRRASRRPRARVAGPRAGLSRPRGGDPSVSWARTVSALRDATRAGRSKGPVGFVPTMGALHRGHTTLFDVARRESGLLVASVFVNPTQFNDAA